MSRFGNTLLATLPMLAICASCSAALPSESSSCIPSDATSSYKPGLRRQDETTAPPFKPMPIWWEPQLDIFQRNIPLLTGATDLVSRSTNEIWVAGFPVGSDDSILRFDVNKGQTKGYVILDVHGRPFTTDQLLVTSDNSLWALLDAAGAGYSTLARYNASKDEFDVVHDQDGLLDLSSTQITVAPRPPQALLAQAPDGRLVIGMNGEIYLYDPTTNEASKVLTHSSGLAVTSLAVSQDGHVWFVSKADNSVRELDPVTGAIRNFGPPPGSDSSNPNDQLSWMWKPLEVDRQGRIWAADFGWLAPEGGKVGYIWHPLKRSTVFISIYDPEVLYKWERPFGSYQFSDTDLWFQSIIGIARFDSKANRWCWVATRYGPLTEDQAGHVWLVDGQIYRYKYILKP